MFTFFKLPYLFQGGQYTDPTLNRLLKQQLDNLTSKITGYYHDAQPPVENNHPLARLTGSFVFSPLKDNLSIYASIRDTINSLASMSGINTSIRFVGGHDGLLYPNCTDYLVSVNKTSLDAILSIHEGNWRQQIPLQVMYQPYILGADYYPEGGNGSGFYSVWTIDIPLLAVMYKYWLLENSQRAAGTQESPNHFIGRYVLSNALYSQFTTTMWNMLSVGEVITDIPEGPGIAIVTYEKPISGRLRRLKSALQSKDDTLEEMVKQIPTYDPSIQLDTHLLPWGIPITTESYPTLILGWIPFIAELVSWVQNENVMQDMRNRWKKIQREFRSRRPMSQFTDMSTKAMVNDYLDIISAYLE